MSGLVVLVVDVQRALVEGEHAVRGASAFVARLQSLLARAREAEVPVVHLQDRGARDHLIRYGTTGWQLAIPPAPDEHVVEKAHDDGFDDTELGHVLEQHDATGVVIVGIQSEMCVAATARGALARGLHVVLPQDGHTTFDIPGSAARAAVQADVVSRVAAWSLGDAIEEPASVDTVTF